MTYRIFIFTVLCIGLSLPFVATAQTSAPYISKVWVADQGDGTYKNPILHADYSDPDICRAGDDFYMTSSSFNSAPGLPILHSKDLVNWELIGYALKRQPPFDHFSVPQHGNGVWAPSIRYHNEHFYIYYGDPDFGIYMVKAENAAGPWDEPVLVQEGKGLIDPCPLWDDNGKAYLVHAFAGSRAGIKSVLTINKMNPEGTKLLDEGAIVFDGHEKHPTIEGPKFYKRDGYYYIFSPAGGVPTGWQLVLRSKNVYGPYESKIVMDQGSTDINGPHQGGWVELKSGESWFVHFQDKEAYGRIVHLEPMKWKDDWPVIGEDQDGDGKGQPVSRYQKPDVGRSYPRQTPVESDEFNDNTLGLQWQWHANPGANWAFSNGAQGYIRLYTVQLPDEATSLWQAPNLLLQKFPAERFTATTHLIFQPNEDLEDEQTGLLVMGEDYAHLSIVSKKDGMYIVYSSAQDVRHGNEEQPEIIKKLEGNEIYFRVEVTEGAICQFSYSENGKKFKEAGDVFTARPGRWIGAKIGLFAIRKDKTNDSGYADYDWFRITPIK